MSQNTHHTCSRCLESKPCSEFNKDARYKSGLASYCRDCYREYSRLRHYGITKEEYEQLLKEQQSRCAICECELDLWKNTHIDHDHADGRVRGVLCGTCNRGLGQFRDSQDLLQRAIDYVS